MRRGIRISPHDRGVSQGGGLAAAERAQRKVLRSRSSGKNECWPLQPWETCYNIGRYFVAYRLRRFRAGGKPPTIGPLAGKDGTDAMGENLVELMVGDPSLSEQFLSTFRRGEPLEPEKALLMAVLEDAIHQYRKYRRARDRDGQERFREVADWIMADDDRWIFSFRNVCELLSLDPDFVRRSVLERKTPGAREQRPRQERGARRKAA